MPSANLRESVQVTLFPEIEPLTSRPGPRPRPPASVPVIVLPSCLSVKVGGAAGPRPPLASGGACACVVAPGTTAGGAGETSSVHVPDTSVSVFDCGAACVRAAKIISATNTIPTNHLAARFIDALSF